MVRWHVVHKLAAEPARWYHEPRPVPHNAKGSNLISSEGYDKSTPDIEILNGHHPNRVFTGVSKHNPVSPNPVENSSTRAAHERFCKRAG
jgi:hypothetical protein